jgi:hypothetical protein
MAPRIEEAWPDAAKKILDYLHRHPQAMDTVDGVAQWWVKKDIFLVHEALVKLSRMRMIGRRKSSSGDMYFRVKDALDL